MGGLPPRYKLVAYLARPTYSEVVEAINTDRNSTAVALKLLRAEGSHVDLARLMFRREVEALKGLKHDAIVQIIDSFEGDDGLLGIELELIPGGASLAKLLEEVAIGRTAPPSPEWRLRQASRLADAVLEAHRRAVVHRDIKPGNVLWNRDEEVLKLADFGIAAVLRLTARGPEGGTLRNFFSRPYASPEQLLQKQPNFSSDVYSFGLLVVALLSLREPGEDFEPGQLGGLMGDVLDEFRQGGVGPLDVNTLSETLAAALQEDPGARPSLPEIRDVLDRLHRTFVPRPEATISLTPAARDKLHAAGFVTDAKILEDFNADLRVRLDSDDRGAFVRAFGRTLFAIIRSEARDADELRIRDAGQNPGPTHESHRQAAEPCLVRLRLGRGSGAALIEFAQTVHCASTQRATHELIDRARLIIRIERERLPVFEVDGVAQGGTRIGGQREDHVARASGYTSSQVERVEVNGGFRLRVSEQRLAVSPTKRSVVREHLEGDAIAVEEPDVFDDAAASEWYSMFDDPSGVDVQDNRGHIVGKVTGYEKASNTLHINTDKPRTLLRSGVFYVKNYQKERQLRQQETAIDVLSRGEAARSDLAQLLSEAAVHRMGAKPFVELLQERLVPKARVQDLVDRILASESVFCLQGPPGTGKTTIIAEVVAQALEAEPATRILVCAQANDAVANAVEKILALRKELKRDWIVVRDVRAERASEEGAWSGYENAYREFAQRIRTRTRAVAPSNDTPTEPIRDAVNEWVESVEHRSGQVARDYHSLVQVWGTTTAVSTRPLRELEGEPYDLVIVDEAAKATVGEVLVPIVRAKRLLLVGDQLQLPPFLENTTTEALEEVGVTEEDAKRTLFEHLFDLVPLEHRDMLDMQFRMHPTIGDVVSHLFYGGRVKNGKDTGNRPLPAGDFDRDHRVLWIDIVGNDYNVGKSRANDEERALIERMLTKLDSDARGSGVTLTVAVIAAYRAQADKLEVNLRDAETRWPSLKIKAATVDSFQGREADVVLYSLVRTGDAERRFLADGRRFNVALSRARSLLVLIGDRTGGRRTELLARLLEMIPDENQVSADSFAPGPSPVQQLATAWGAKTRTINNRGSGKT